MKSYAFIYTGDTSIFADSEAEAWAMFESMFPDYESAECIPAY